MDKIAAKEKELEVPILPKICEHVFAYFCALNRERCYGGMGDPLPLRAPEIIAWKTLYNITLLPHEIMWIRDLDNVFLTVQAKKL